MYGRLEAAANVAVLITSCLLAGFLVQRSCSTTTNDAARGPEVTPGMKIEIDGVDWQAPPLTTVLALNTSCRFCTESAAFYREISRAAAAVDVPVLALFPQTESEGRAYLGTLEVRVDDVRQIRLSTVRVRITPTVIVVDRQGTVLRAWHGRLASELEQEVLAFIGSRGTASRMQQKGES